VSDLKFNSAGDATWDRGFFAPVSNPAIMRCSASAVKTCFAKTLENPVEFSENSLFCKIHYVS
jgi:hypothetical protein